MFQPFPLFQFGRYAGVVGFLVFFCFGRFPPDIFISVISNEPCHAVGFDAPVQLFSGDCTRGETEQKAVCQESRRAAKQRERELLSEGAGAQIRIPYSQGGQKALGVAFAEQQIVAAILKNPALLRIDRKSTRLNSSH